MNSILDDIGQTKKREWPRVTGPLFFKGKLVERTKVWSEPLGKGLVYRWKVIMAGGAEHAGKEPFDTYDDALLALKSAVGRGE